MLTLSITKSVTDPASCLSKELYEARSMQPKWDERLSVVHIRIPYFVEGCSAYDLQEMSVKWCLTEGLLKNEILHVVYISD